MSRIVYFAGPLFTQGERKWNTRIADGLRAAGFGVILPQERTGEMTQRGEPLPVRRIYESCIEGIRSADVVIAILDGADPDSGTSFECGYAAALGKSIIGLRTDLRLGGDDPTYNVNLMLSQASCHLVHVASESEQDVIEGVVTAILACTES